jgi:hypothetical protein
VNKGDEKIQAEAGEMQSWTGPYKECMKVLEAGRQRIDFSPRAFERRQICQYPDLKITLSDF